MEKQIEKNMVQAYTESSMLEVPEGANIDNSYWNYFLILEADFKRVLQYIHLADSPDHEGNSNFKTYSLELAKQLISIASEFETIAKLLCEQINGSKPGNIGQYKETILPRFPKISSTPIIVSRYKLTISPLKPWEKKGGSLTWWDAYVSMKHGRHLHFEKATLENVLYALGSLMILESYLYKLALPDERYARFGTTLLRVPGMAEVTHLVHGALPDFKK